VKIVKTLEVVYVTQVTAVVPLRVRINGLYPERGPAPKRVSKNRRAKHGDRGGRA